MRDTGGVDGPNGAEEVVFVGLASEIPLKQHSKAAFATFSLKEDESVVFALREVGFGAGRDLSISVSKADELFMGP